MNSIVLHSYVPELPSFEVGPKSTNCINCVTKQKNSRTVRLCLLLWKIIIVDFHFAHVSPWLFTIPITKPFLDIVHFLLKCGSSTKATHLSLAILKLINQQLPKLGGALPLIYFAYTCVRDLFIGGLFILKNGLQGDGILHVNMFHYF